MNLEVRILNNNAEVHVIDMNNSRPISVIKSDLKALNKLLVSLMSQYSVRYIYRSKKPLLTN
jgi:hypothetical protein